jgi:hypothetical protein
MDHAWHTVGTSYHHDNPWPDGDLYVETNLLSGMRYSTDGDTPSKQGAGSYITVSWVPSPWKFTLSAKDYRGYEYEFRRPPTLEEDVVASINNESVAATKLGIERVFGAHALSLSTLYGYDGLIRTQIYHGVVGGRMRLIPVTLEWKTGYRDLPTDSNLTHASIGLKIPTFSVQSLDIMLRKQIERRFLSLLPSHEDRNVTEVTYRFSSRWNAGAGLEFVPTNAEELGRYFGNLSASYASGDLTVRAFLGQTSGGTRCSAGVCRRIPPFSGGSIEAHISL